MTDDIEEVSIRAGNAIDLQVSGLGSFPMIHIRGRRMFRNNFLVLEFLRHKKTSYVALFILSCLREEISRGLNYRLKYLPVSFPLLG